MKSKLIFPAAALFALSACGSSGLLDRERPDEFAVSRGAPLAVPAEFTLSAPQEGAAPTQQADTKQQMIDAMFGTTTPK
jgi:Protein of unknown function (DUF3035)